MTSPGTSPLMNDHQIFKEHQSELEHLKHAGQQWWKEHTYRHYFSALGLPSPSGPAKKTL